MSVNRIDRIEGWTWRKEVQWFEYNREIPYEIIHVVCKEFRRDWEWKVSIHQYKADRGAIINIPVENYETIKEVFKRATLPNSKELQGLYLKYKIKNI